MTDHRKEAVPPTKKNQTMTLRVLRRVKLGDSREVRVVKIPTPAGNLIRIGINLLPGGENMSGAVFPESNLDEVIEALQGVRNG